MSSISAFEQEAKYLANLYRILDELLEAARLGLGEQRLGDVGSTFQARSERDAMARMIEDRIVRFEALAERLCFGKVVHREGNDELYFGRAGLFDEQGEAVLVDWRAPAAEPFYRATPSDPMGLVFRRHLITGGRTLLDLEDEILDLKAVRESSKDNLVGSAALLAALGRRRTGRMGDIVATIQKDQDEVIRAPLGRTLVMAGGPGTGKTVVALHRAAYLLFAHRQRIGDDGVLLVGPTPLFIHYVEQVLPSLGEAAVLLLDWSQLVYGVDAVGEDEPEVQEIKGSLAMATMLRRAVRLFQRAPKNGVEVIGADGRAVVLPAERLVELRRRCRGLNEPHNLCRSRYEAGLAREIGIDRLSAAPKATVNSIRAAADRLWPKLTAADLLGDLYRNPRILAKAADSHLTPDQQERLVRSSARSDWTVSDLALLDEATALLGPVHQGQSTKHENAARQQELRYAEEVVETFHIKGLVPPEYLADRFASTGDHRSVTEMARIDPSWKFGHVIVDEAQDVTPMQWRALGRRSKGYSMTIVGDLDQSSIEDRGSWADRIAEAIPAAQIELHEFRVNYRTPEQTMGPALALRRRYAGSALPEPIYVRSSSLPWLHICQTLSTAAVVEEAHRALEELGDFGRVAVIVAGPPGPDLEEALHQLGQQAPGSSDSRLDRRVAVYAASEVKGLEFDYVIVSAPDAIFELGGWRLLYVALSRSTDRLGILGDKTSAQFLAAWLEPSSYEDRHGSS